MGAISGLVAAGAKYAARKAGGYLVKKIKKKAYKKAGELAGKHLGPTAQKAIEEQTGLKPKPRPAPAREGGFSKINKGEVNMVKKGMVKEKGPQSGAYSVQGGFGQQKKANAASSIVTHAQKKLLTEPRALTYSKFGAMKTRK